jgi:hypothetical protein
MRNISDKKSCRENQNTHFVFSNFVFENLALFLMRECGKKYGRAGKTKDDNVADAHCMLGS